MKKNPGRRERRKLHFDLMRTDHKTANKANAIRTQRKHDK